MEARRKKNRADNEAEIRSLREQISRLEKLEDDYDIELSNLNKERQALESELDQRELEANEIKKDIAEETRINDTMRKKIKDLEKEI